MATEELNVKTREKTGKHVSKHMRRAGQIPAILYGHGKESISLSLDRIELETAIRHSVHLVQLKGAVSETALLKELQWDAYGNDVLHVDLTRVYADEMVEVEIAIHLRGVAPGTKKGGVVDHQAHSVMIECPATSIPEFLELNINSLELDQELLAKDLTLPPKARLLVEDDLTVVACAEPVEVSEELTPVDGAEPEVIGDKDEKESGEGD